MRILAPTPTFLALSTLAALATTAAPLAAQAFPTGDCVNPNLPTAASTRALAMGDANTAGRDDDVIFYGPAQLAVARGTSVSAERYADRLASGTLASTARIGSGGVGLGVSLVNGRSVGSCLQQDTLPGGGIVLRTAPANFARALAAVGGAQTFKKFRIGVTGKYVFAQQGDDHDSRVLGDVGVSRDVSFGDNGPVTLAFAAQNIGSTKGDAALQAPLRTALGAATGMPVGRFDLVLAGQLGAEQNPGHSGFQDGKFLAGGGAELGYSWLDGYSVALRIGARTAPVGTDVRGFTAGAGLVYDRLAVDYAVETLVGSRLAHRIGFRLR